MLCLGNEEGLDPLVNKIWMEFLPSHACLLQSTRREAPPINTTLVFTWLTTIFEISK